MSSSRLPDHLRFDPCVQPLPEKVSLLMVGIEGGAASTRPGTSAVASTARFVMNPMLSVGGLSLAAGLIQEKRIC